MILGQCKITKQKNRLLDYVYSIAAGFVRVCRQPCWPFVCCCSLLFSTYSSRLCTFRLLRSSLTRFPTAVWTFFFLFLPPVVSTSRPLFHLFSFVTFGRSFKSQDAHIIITIYSLDVQYTQYIMRQTCPSTSPPFFFSLHVSNNWSSRDFTLNSPYQL